MFKLSPGLITSDGQKVPINKGWRDEASGDQERLKSWFKQYGSNPNFRWIIPTGSVNDILVLDLDAKHNAMQNLADLGLTVPQTFFQQTLSGGYHFFFKYPNDGKKYGNKVNIKFKELGDKKSGVDTRGEGGYVMWYSQTPCSIPIAEAPTWLLDKYNAQDETLRTDAAPVTFDNVIATQRFTAALETVRNAPVGQSNDILNVQSFIVGQLVAAGSFSYEYAYEQLYKAAIERGKPPYEAQETIKSGLNGGIKKPAAIELPATPPTLNFQVPPPPEPPARWTPRRITFEGLKDRSKLRQPQLFENWSTQDIMLTAADGGTGKTTLKIFEVVCMALGERFLGFECKRPGGKTLFITGEDTEAKIISMIGMVCEQMGIMSDPVKMQKVMDSIAVKKDSDLCLVDRLKNGFIVPSRIAFDKVLEAVEDFGPDLIIFDPIASFWGSESALNDMAKAVTTFISRLTERGIAVEMINHIGKSSSQSKDATQFAGRGGTGLPSHSRVSRVLYPLTETDYLEYTGKHLEDGHSAILCTINKFSDGSPLYNKPFIILRKGYLFTKEDIMPIKQLENMNKKTDAERVFTFIKDVREQGKYPTLKYVCAHFKSLGPDKISDARVKEALQVLKIDGHLGETVKETDHPDGTQTEKVIIIEDIQGREV